MSEELLDRLVHGVLVAYTVAMTVAVVGLMVVTIVALWRLFG